MKTNRRQDRLDRLAKILFVIGTISLIWAWGVMSVIRQMFPYPQLRDMATQSRVVLSLLLEEASIELPIYYTDSSYEPTTRPSATTSDPERLLLVSHMIADRGEVVRIIDDNHRILHEWTIDWFELWPDPDHLTDKEIPKSRPGTSIHGLVFMPDGSLVFNFENLGLMRLDYCGEVSWRLPYRTHHSVDIDSTTGNLWVAGKLIHDEALPALPNHIPPFEEPTVLEVSPRGEVLREFSVPQLLIENQLHGLLYLSTRNNYGTRVTGDTLHLNDVEHFPADLEPGLFGIGDVMISLRNINAIIVFNATTRKIKFVSIGKVLRQHDPDFIDGNTISVFDNNNLSPSSTAAPLITENQQSRIVKLDAPSGELSVLYSGDKSDPFFTDIMGKHQWLANDHVLITGARAGRSFEIDATGTVVWDYVNQVGDNLVGLIDDTQVLPNTVNAERLEAFETSCLRN